MIPNFNFRIRRFWPLCTWLSFALAGCGSDPSGNSSLVGGAHSNIGGANSNIGGANSGTDGTSGQSTNGQVTDAWRDFCVATFTSDTPIQDLFGDTAFTAHAGERYLLMELDTFGGSPRVKIAYLTSLGPDTYEVPVTGGAETFPFTSNCTIGNTVEYYATFTDVTVYATKDLNDVICTLPAGTALPRDTSTNSGSSIIGFALGGPQTYDIMLNAYSGQCGNGTDGYVNVPETQVLGVTTWLVPIDVVLKAK